MTDDQACRVLHGMIADIGNDYADSRKQMFWHVARLTGLSVARITSLFYGKGVKPSMVDYLTIQARWEQLSLDVAASRVHAEINRTRELIDVEPPLGGQAPDGSRSLFEPARGARHHLSKPLT